MKGILGAAVLLCVLVLSQEFEAKKVHERGGGRDVDINWSDTDSNGLSLEIMRSLIRGENRKRRALDSSSGSGSSSGEHTNTKDRGKVHKRGSKSMSSSLERRFVCRCGRRKKKPRDNSE